MSDKAKGWIALGIGLPLASALAFFVSLLLPPEPLLALLVGIICGAPIGVYTASKWF